MLKKIKYLLTLVLLLSLTGCKLTLLDPKGVIAVAEKNLLVDAVLLMLIVVIPTIILSFVFMWRYRIKNASAKYAPNWAHSHWLEAVCWVVPIIIIAVLATMTWISTHKLDPYRPLVSKKKPIIIEAVSLNWKWLFIYPEQHIATVNYLQIPTNVPIRFLVTADGPMNSLDIPQLAGQIYAMSGMRTKLNLMANEPGTYNGMSTNFSGEGFSGMRFIVKATSTMQFNRWVKSVQSSQPPLTMARYYQLAKPSENNPPQMFSSPANHLFNKIMKQYMGSNMKMSANQ